MSFTFYEAAFRWIHSGISNALISCLSSLNRRVWRLKIASEAQQTAGCLLIIGTGRSFKSRLCSCKTWDALPVQRLAHLYCLNSLEIGCLKGLFTGKWLDSYGVRWVTESQGEVFPRLINCDVPILSMNFKLKTMLICLRQLFEFWAQKLEDNAKMNSVVEISFKRAFMWGFLMRIQKNYYRQDS